MPARSLRKLPAPRRFRTVDLRAAPALPDVLHVVRHMRQRDFEEIFATRYGSDRAEFAQEVVSTGDFRWGAYLDGKPVAMIGAVPRWPRVWSVWAFGTDDWPAVALSLTKHVRRFMLPALYRSGAIRADCMALATHDDARRWLRALGAREENTVDNWGKNGQKFVSYVWTRKEAQAALSRR